MAKKKTKNPMTKAHVKAFFDGCAIMAQMEQGKLPLKVGVPFRSKKVRNQAALAEVEGEINGALEELRRATREVMEKHAVKDADGNPKQVPTDPGFVKFDYGATPVGVVDEEIENLQEAKDLQEILAQEVTGVQLLQVKTEEWPESIENLFEHFRLMISDFV